MATETPSDLVSDLGLEEQVSPLVNLIHANDSKALTADVIRFAMATAVRAVCLYQMRCDEPVEDVRKRILSRFGVFLQ